MVPFHVHGGSSLPGGTPTRHLCTASRHPRQVIHDADGRPCPAGRSLRTTRDAHAWPTRHLRARTAPVATEGSPGPTTYGAPMSSTTPPPSRPRSRATPAPTTAPRRPRRLRGRAGRRRGLAPRDVRPQRRRHVSAHRRPRRRRHSAGSPPPPPPPPAVATPPRGGRGPPPPSRWGRPQPLVATRRPRRRRPRAVTSRHPRVARTTPGCRGGAPPPPTAAPRATTRRSSPWSPASPAWSSPSAAAGSASCSVVSAPCSATSPAPRSSAPVSARRARTWRSVASSPARCRPVDHRLRHRRCRNVFGS